MSGSVTDSLGQSRKVLKAERKLLKEGDIEYEYNKFGLALPYFLDALELVPDNPETLFKVGKCYLETKERKKALDPLVKSFELDPGGHPEILFNLGLAYHYNEKFDEAIECFEKYKANSAGNAVNITDANQQILECKTAIYLMANPVDVEIINLGPVINSAYSDYAPVVSADENVMVFTSRREGSTGGQLDEAGVYYEDLYISERKGGKWGVPKNMEEINTEDHEASVGLSPDGKKLLIYRSEGKGDVYYCTQDKNGVWVKPKKFPKEISDKSTYENSASICSDKVTLYFSSDRPGGYGGLDIWVVHKDPEKDKWDDPVNLGPAINTVGDEESPFIDVDKKTLYFSSNHHRGMGLFDVFKSTYDSTYGKWSEPENLGYPINTVEDDIFFVLSGDGKRAYFNSIKEDGYGGEDIYEIIMPEREDLEERIALVEEVSGHKYEPEVVPEPEPEPEIVEVAPEPEPIILQNVIIKGVVFEQPTGTALGAAVVELLDPNGEVIKQTNSSNTGEFRFDVPMDFIGKVGVSASKEGYLYQTRELAVPQRTEEEIVLSVELNLRKPVENARIILRNIYFDFDQHTLKEESFHELLKLVELMNSKQDVTAEVVGHTDDIGSHEYNVSLSEQRSGSVVNYLVQQGVDKSRLTVVGMGESRPLASNDDEEEGRELNRRTEFVIKHP